LLQRRLGRGCSGRCYQRGRQDSLVGEPPRFFLMEIITMTRHAGNLGGEPQSKTARSYAF
jgi:hypothetical protein